MALDSILLFRSRFRHQVSQLYDASQVSRDWAGTVSSTLSLRVRREKLMQDSLHTLQQVGGSYDCQVTTCCGGHVTVRLSLAMMLM